MNRLRERLRMLDVGGSGLISMVGKPRVARGFFPGGNGLILGESAVRFPFGGTLVLGSNFGAAEKFCNADGRLLGRLDETRDWGTWCELRVRFTNQQLEDTFFTNAWPLLHSSPARPGRAASNLGTPRRWLEDPALMTSCLGFFRFTLVEVRPRVIIALGIAPAAFLSHIFPLPLAPWRVPKLASLDALPLATVIEGDTPMVCTAITHPSQARVNAPLRKEPYRGLAGEQRLLAEAFARAEALTQEREQATT